MCYVIISGGERAQHHGSRAAAVCGDVFVDRLLARIIMAKKFSYEVVLKLEPRILPGEQAHYEIVVVRLQGAAVAAVNRLATPEEEEVTV